MSDRTEKGGINSNLHAVIETLGRPIRLFMTAGKVTDYTGAKALMNSLPDVGRLLSDPGYNTDWFRDTLTDKGETPFIERGKSRYKPVNYDKRQYTRQNQIEIIISLLKDWRLSLYTTDVQRYS